MPEQSSVAAKGPLSFKIQPKRNKDFICRLDLPFEQQLVIKLTAQRAHALALASQSIEVHSAGNSFFWGIPGQKAGVT